MLKSNEIEFLKRIHEKILKYVDQDNERSFSALKDIEYLLSGIDLTIDEPNDLQGMEAFIDQYLEYSVNTSSTNFYNQLYSGFSSMGYVGEAITGLTNNSMHAREMSPVATLMERTLIKKMSGLIGYENGFGTFVSEGSNANLIAMLCARERFNSKSRQSGLFNSNPLVAFISEEAHHSFYRAGYQLGIGLDQVRQVSCDINGRMDMARLEEMLISAKEDGEIPFFIGATAGTTIRGVFDPLDEIAELSERHGIWFHIDGSWGGATLLSKRHGHLVQGSASSDSFSWCAHKMMGIPITCAAIILKDHNILEKMSSLPRTDHIFYDKENEEIDLGLHSMPYSRRVNSIKLWLSWKYLGDTGYEKKINHLFSMAKHAEHRVRDSDMLCLVSPVESLNVCFRVQHDQLGNDEWDDLTIRVRETMIKDGNIMVNHAKIDGLSCIRLVTVNFDLAKDDIDYFFEQVESTSTYLVNEKFN